MNKKLLIIALILIVCMTGCKNNEVVDINPYTEDEEIIRYTIDTLSYSEAIEDLIFYSGWEIKDVDKIIEKHKQILTDNFITHYRETADHTGFMGEIEPPEIDTGDGGYEDYVEEDGDIEVTDTENEEYDNINYTDALSELETPEFKNDTLENKSVFKDIIAYALDEGYTEELMDDSVNNIEDDKVYTVLTIDAYKDRLVASVNYKYGTPMKVVVQLVDNKIDGYEIYR